MRSIIKSARTVEEAIDLGLKDIGLTRDEIEVEILEEPKKGLFGIIGSKDAIVKITQKLDFKIDINDIYGKDKQEEKKSTKRVEEKKAEDQKEKKHEVYKEEKKHEVYIEAEKAKETIDKLGVEIEKHDTKEQVKTPSVKIESKTAKPQKESIVEEKNTKSQEEKKENSIDYDKMQARAVEILKTLLEKIHVKADVKASMEGEIVRLNIIDISEEDTGIVIGRKGETLDSIQLVMGLIITKEVEKYTRVIIDVADYRQRRKEAIENKARKAAFRVLKTKRSMALEPMNAYDRRIVHFALQDYKEIETVSQGSFPNRKVIVKYKG